MCKICGEPAGVHPQVDKMFEDMPENMADAFGRLAQTFQERVENGVSEAAILGASFLINAMRHPEMPVPSIMGTERGALVMDWRQGNRILEIEAEADGQTFEFVVGQVEAPTSDNDVAELVAQTGKFTLDDIKNPSEDDRGPGLMADWLVGGEFAESLDRYIHTEDSEDICLDSEYGSEPMNTIKVD